MNKIIILILVIFLSIFVFNFLDQEIIVEQEFSLSPKSCLAVEDIPSPKALMFTPDEEEIWITSLMNQARGVVVLDRATGEVKNNIVLPDGGGVEITFNSDGSLAYVSQMETARVFEIDTESKEIKRTFETNSAWTKVVLVKDNYLYASNWSGNNISIIDLTTGELIKNISTVRTPRGIYIYNNHLYVAGFDRGEVAKINLEDYSQEIIYETGGAMRHIVGNSNNIFFSDMGEDKIYRLDLNNQDIFEFVETDINPNTIALTDEWLIVSNRGANNSESYYIPGPEWGTIQFFDLEGNLIYVIIAGNQPTALDVSQHYLAYSDFLDGRVTICPLEIKEFNKNYKKEIKK